MKVQKPGASESDNQNKETPPAKTGSDAGKADDASGKQGGDNQDQGEPDDSKWSEEDRAYIKGLRGENAKYRTKAKNLEGELATTRDRLSKLEKALKSATGTEDDKEADPEATIGSLQGQLGTLEMQNAVLLTAVEHGIGKDGLEYYEFLLNKKLATLEEGEEMSDEDYAEIVSKVKAASGSGAGQGTKTSVTNKGGATPPPGGADEVTVDQFCAMSFTERSLVYSKNPALYERLTAEAKKQGKFV